MSKPRAAVERLGVRARAHQRPGFRLGPGVAHVRILRQAAAASLTGRSSQQRTWHESRMFSGQLVEGRSACSTLGVGHGTRVAIENLHPARRAARISAATMENVDPGVHDGQHKSLAIRARVVFRFLPSRTSPRILLPSIRPQTGRVRQMLPITGHTSSRQRAVPSALRRDTAGPPTNRCRKRSENSAACGPASTTEPTVSMPGRSRSRTGRRWRLRRIGAPHRRSRC